MDHEADLNRKKDKIKIIRDFSFLLQIEPTVINQHCMKYLVEEGKGDILNDIQENFDIVYSLKQYDYEGKRMNQYSEGKLSKLGKNNQLTQLLLTMRLQERAWFNLCQQQVFKQRQMKADILEVIQEDDNLQEEPEIKAVPQDEEDHLQRTGYHYELYVTRIEYKNKDDMETKRKIFAQKKEEAKNKFNNKDFLEAAKIYKYLDSISSGYSKKIFTQENTIQLDQMNQNSKVNYLKTFFKMLQTSAQFPEEIQSHAAIAIGSLIKTTENDPVVHFLNAKWLLKERYLDQAFREAQRSYKLKATAEAQKLMILIKQQKENKGKIKVAVQEHKKQ